MIRYDAALDASANFEILWNCEVELSKFLTSLHRFRDCARSVVRLFFEFLNDVLIALPVAILIEFERGFKARNRDFETDYAAR